MKSPFLKLKIRFGQIGNTRRRCLSVSWENRGQVTGALPHKILKILLAHSPTIPNTEPPSSQPKVATKAPPNISVFWAEEGTAKLTERTTSFLRDFLCALESFPSFNSPISMCQLSSRKIPGSYHVTLCIGRMTTQVVMEPSVSLLWAAHLKIRVSIVLKEWERLLENIPQSLPQLTTLISFTLGWAFTRHFFFFK